MDTLTIDCDECVMSGTAACADCVVTAMCGGTGATVLTMDHAEQRAVRLLGRSGLVPPLRHLSRAG